MKKTVLLAIGLIAVMPGMAHAGGSFSNETSTGKTRTLTAKARPVRVPTQVSTDSKDLRAESSAVNVAAPVVNQSNSNSQFNESNSFNFNGYAGEQPYSKIGNTSCATPNIYLQGGVTGDLDGGHHGYNNTQGGVYGGIQIPLNQGRCRKMQALLLEHEKINMKFKQRKYCVDLVARDIVDPICEKYGITKRVVTVSTPPVYQPPAPPVVPPVPSVPGLW